MTIPYVQLLYIIFNIWHNFCSADSDNVQGEGRMVSRRRLPDLPTKFIGDLTNDCMKNYYEMLAIKEVPPRTYKYFHEFINSRRSLPQYNARSDRSDIEQQAKHSYRIMGGNQISIREAPYQVLYGLYCGGTLIAPEWVITAAHCKTKEKFVYAGSTRRSRATQYPICAHFLHPYWNSSYALHSYDFDYQLVLLEKPVPVTVNSRPIMIGSTDDIQPGTLAVVSGWGFLKFKTGKMEDILRRVYVPIWSKEECMALPRKNYKVLSPRMFCVGYHNGTKDSCQGDSGGPLVVRNKLVALVSFGIGCGLPNLPGVYTNIPLARDWIRAVTGLPL